MIKKVGSRSELYVFRFRSTHQALAGQQSQSHDHLCTSDIQLLYSLSLLYNIRMGWTYLVIHGHDHLTKQVKAKRQYVRMIICVIYIYGHNEGLESMMKVLQIL